MCRHKKHTCIHTQSLFNTQTHIQKHKLSYTHLHAHRRQHIKVYIHKHDKTIMKKEAGRHTRNQPYKQIATKHIGLHNKSIHIQN